MVLVLSLDPLRDRQLPLTEASVTGHSCSYVTIYGFQFWCVLTAGCSDDDIDVFCVISLQAPAWPPLTSQALQRC